MMHKVEVLFDREFTLEEAEALKDKLFEAISEFEVNSNCPGLWDSADVVIMDATTS